MGREPVEKDDCLREILSHENDAEEQNFGAYEIDTLMFVFDNLPPGHPRLLGSLIHEIEKREGLVP